MLLRRAQVRVRNQQVKWIRTLIPSTTVMEMNTVMMATTIAILGSFIRMLMITLKVQSRLWPLCRKGHWIVGPESPYSVSLPFSTPRSWRRQVLIVGLASNVGLTISKGLAGLWMNSASLLAEAGHSLSDLLGVCPHDETRTSWWVGFCYTCYMANISKTT